MRCHKTIQGIRAKKQNGVLLFTLFSLIAVFLGEILDTYLFKCVKIVQIQQFEKEKNPSLTKSCPQAEKRFGTAGSHDKKIMFRLYNVFYAFALLDEEYL